MARNGRKWLGNGDKLLENGWKSLEIAVNVWKWLTGLELAEISGIGCKLMKMAQEWLNMAGNGFK